MKKIHFLTLFFLFSHSFAAAQWKANWITHPTADLDDYGVYHFRRTFELSEKPTTFVIHVSADNRYKLYVNGTQASFGPARSDLAHWRYETVDIAPYLNVGKNTLAALVFNGGEGKAVAQLSHQTAFVLEGNTEKEKVISTNDKEWKVMQNEAYKPLKITNWGENQMIWGFYAVGTGDIVAGEKYPWGWENTDFDDTNWLKPRQLNRAVLRGATFQNPWLLMPRPIPQMEQKLERAFKLVRNEGIAADNGFLKGEKNLIIPKNTKAILLLDHTYMTVGYPEMKVSKGKNSEITVIYSEALYDAQREKGNRNQIEGKKINGARDIFNPDGGENRSFTPLWLRSFRYVQLEIQTNENELVIHDYSQLATTYPFEEKAKFKADDVSLSQIWKVGWRTARLCAGETYFDCPYYEQLNYEGDTRIQALISMYVSGDDRLVRDAINQFSYSKNSDGLVEAAYPANFRLLIPPYALYYISIIHDFHLHRNDRDFVKPLLSGMNGILEWYEGYLNEKGMLNTMPWWNFLDWCPEYKSGVPPEDAQGNNAALALHYANALDHAAALFADFGRNYEAERWKKVSEKVKKSVLQHTYDTKKQLLADTPEKKTYSQHANIMAILTDAVPQNEQKALMQKVLADTSLVQCTLYYRFYLNQALHKSGLDKYLDELKPWRTMLADGLTTFAESDKRAVQRSDCHAWSASPNYDFLATVCGIRPASFGFQTVEIKPSLGNLKEVEANMPHPAGEISVKFKRKRNQGIAGTITLPNALSGKFVWNGKSILLKGGSQEIEIQ